MSESPLMCVSSRFQPPGWCGHPTSVHASTSSWPGSMLLHRNVCAMPRWGGPSTMSSMSPTCGWPVIPLTPGSRPQLWWVLTRLLRSRLDSAHTVTVLLCFVNCFCQIFQLFGFLKKISCTTSLSFLFLVVFEYLTFSCNKSVLRIMSVLMSYPASFTRAEPTCRQRKCRGMPWLHSCPSVSMEARLTTNLTSGSSLPSSPNSLHPRALIQSFRWSATWMVRLHWC